MTHPCASVCLTCGRMDEHDGLHICLPTMQYGPIIPAASPSKVCECHGVEFCPTNWSSKCPSCGRSDGTHLQRCFTVSVNGQPLVGYSEAFEEVEVPKAVRPSALETRLRERAEKLEKKLAEAIKALVLLAGTPEDRQRSRHRDPACVYLRMHALKALDALEEK